MKVNWDDYVQDMEKWKMFQTTNQDMFRWIYRWRAGELESYQTSRFFIGFPELWKFSRRYPEYSKNWSGFAPVLRSVAIKRQVLTRSLYLFIPVPKLPKFQPLTIREQTCFILWNLWTCLFPALPSFDPFAPKIAQHLRATKKHPTQMRPMVLEYLATKLDHFWGKCR